MLTSQAVRSLHPSENVVIPCGCYRELEQPDNCFPSSARFEINYKYFFDRFSGILPQNSGTVTIPFWKQANRSIKQEIFFLRNREFPPLSGILVPAPLC